MVLTWLDYVVIAGYLLAITAFGSWFARFQKTTRDYFLTGRSVPWWAICFTVVATETGTLTFISGPGQAAGGAGAFPQRPLHLLRGAATAGAVWGPGDFRGALFSSPEPRRRPSRAC